VDVSVLGPTTGALVIVINVNKQDN